MAGAIPGAAPVRAADSPTIAVLVSQEAEPHRLVLAGLQRAVRDRQPDATVTVHVMKGDAAADAAAIQDAKHDHVSAIVALGSLAADAVAAERPRVPVVATFVTGMGRLQKLPNAGGVLLDFPPETHVQWLCRLLPTMRTVGVLYNPAENRERITAARQEIARHRLALEATEVRDARELPVAIENLMKRIEVLWGVPDSLVLSPETAKQLLLWSFRSRVPLIGPSVNWVKAGALYALHWDYEDVGAQTAEATLRAIRDSSAGQPPVAFARKVAYSLNRHTARHMKIDFPDALVRGASGVY